MKTQTEAPVNAASIIFPHLGWRPSLLGVSFFGEICCLGPLIDGGQWKMPGKSHRTERHPSKAQGTQGHRCIVQLRISSKLQGV